ncbi:hypothetical protein GO730_05065 [Spirosoma sp. HMF3257]|uniref:hypothetical protein n=1 Tax=Spirosoma telluris TaxID=2183553 RepID=UPI0011B9417B|nr:hypothetical protein [Spirosoma telluris]
MNAVHADNLYLSSSVSAGIRPTQFQAIRIRGGASTCHIRGTIEGFSGMVQVFGRLANSDLHFQLGALHGAEKAVIQLEQGEGTIDKCTIGVNMSVKTTRPFWNVTTSSANQIASCYVKDSEIASNALLTLMMLPEKVVFNPSTTNTRLHSANGQAYTYESGQQYTNIPKTLIRGFKGAASATTIATIQLPTVIEGTSALSVAIRLEGSAGHNIYVSGSSTTIFWQGTLPLPLTRMVKSPSVPQPLRQLLEWPQMHQVIP